jgi:hypothetical protein
MREGDETLLILAQSLVGLQAPSVVASGSPPDSFHVSTHVVLAAAALAATIPTLCGRSERNPMLIKLCLAYDREADIEVRLNHYYQNSYRHDSWHNHRWSFWSCLLCGSAVHRVAAKIDPSAEDCVLFKHRIGDMYRLGSGLFHSFVPEPGTVSLMFRGRVTASNWSRSEIDNGSALLRSPTDIVAEQQVLSSEQYLAALAQIKECLG